MNDVNPDDALARGVRLLQSSHFAQARDLLSEHCRSHPDSSYGWFLLGAASHALGELESALTALRTACDLSPQFVQALSALAAVQLDRGETSAALAHYRRALELEPQDAQLWTNVGVVQGRSGDWQAALQSYDKALDCDAGFAAALMNRGVALSRLGRLEDALANNDRFVELHADSADAHYNRAEVLLALLRFDEAIAACDRACALAPRHAAAHFDRALALTCLGRLEEADAAFETSHACDPNRFASLSATSGLTLSDESRLDTRALYLLRLLARNDACDWRRRDELAEQFEVQMQAAVRSARPIEMPELAFSSLSIPLRRDTRFALVRSVAAGFARRAEGRRPARVVHAARDRIRVGYVSPDFRLHAVALLLQDLFRLHDRSRFEIFAYSLAPDDRSDVRERIASGVDRLYDVADLSDDAIAQRIADDGIDVLVDLAGYTLGSRSGLFARRPARIQVNYLGFAGSLGAEYIDYAIVDSVDLSSTQRSGFHGEAGPAADHVLTRRARFRSSCSPEDRGRAARLRVRVLLLHEQLQDRPWHLRDVDGDPGASTGVLLMACSEPWADAAELEPGGGSPRQRPAQTDLRAAGGVFCLHGTVRPCRPVPGHAVVRNAHSHRAIDALRCGVPVLTLAGETMSSRLGASVLDAAGLPELIMHSLDQYKSRAIELATDRAAFAALRAKLKPHCPELR